MRVEMTIRILAIPLCALVTSGCLTTRTTVTQLTSEPEGALVRVEGYGECETPCSIAIDAPRNVTVAKMGYLAQRFVIVPGRPQVHVIMQLAAPTVDVDQTELPEL
jgi:hypothetical protein